MHIYRWLNSETARDEAGSKQLQSLPALETKAKWTKKIHPGPLRSAPIDRHPYLGPKLIESRHLDFRRKA